MRLVWHPYSYYPYERELARREIKSLFQTDDLVDCADGLELANAGNGDGRRLTYFAQVINGQGIFETTQSLLENTARIGRKRQATRYSVHGLHEYKGKFNPQVARSILNILGVKPGQHVLDPFCGSGTTLVECAHLGVHGYGLDLNPLAIFIAKAKLRALATPAADLRECHRRLANRVSRRQKWQTRIGTTDREIYLGLWFEDSILQAIELLLVLIRAEAGDNADFFLTIASNLLRDYSLQDPNDLRIRRRKTPTPTTPFVEAFIFACERALTRLSDVQAVLGATTPIGDAAVRDVGKLRRDAVPVTFDAAVTSPPYAMALPYIDTQRLSLVWLGLVPPGEILKLERDLIGSRELQGAERKIILARLRDQESLLPEAETSFCAKLASALSSQDGFRRQAVPLVLNRYFHAMQASFITVKRVLRRGAPYALIVGQNHTVLGGTRFDINTPTHLANIASKTGWKIVDILPLQTYQRYGYHMNNAIAAETLITLRND